METAGAKMYHAFLGLGSNMGDRMENLRRAVAEIGRIADVVRTSSVYETEPVGMLAETDFLNMAIEIATDDDPPLLLVSLRKIEKQLGRKTGVKLASRPIDIDILLYRGMAYEDPMVTVPHPGLTARRFVLEPLAEIAPTAVHPTLEKTIGWLHRHCRDTHRVTPAGVFEPIAT
jgi:2-amino-4-hydroxy-6-hydroxymethyldihydropteridine diphosphokinase